MTAGVAVPARPDTDVVEREVETCVALLRPDTGVVVVLNETASDIWRLSDGESTVEAIVHLLARAYRAEATAIRADVERGVALLVEHGFLTLSTG